MIYQQEVKEVNSFYSKYRDKKIVYSKEVSQFIGLVQRDTSIKVGDEVIKGALISSTMESFVIMARLDENLKRAIYDQNGALIVHLKFISAETGKSILFTIHTKFLNFNNQGLAQKDLQFVAMQIRRKIPNDMIRIFGLYHEEAANKLKNKKKKVECLLLANESKSDCITLSISKDLLVLIVDDSQAVILNQKAIAILKIVNTGEVLEIIGTITKKIDESDGRCELHLKYSMDDQSPRFGYSIHVLRNLINS
jgi:PilZN3 domain